MIKITLFQEKPININVEDPDTGDISSFMVFMSPLKVKDIQTLNRITLLQEENPADEQAAIMLIKLMSSTLDIDSSELPVETTDKLLTYFIEYNFPKQEAKKETRREKHDREAGKVRPEEPKKDINDGLIDCFDFLISQGHEYTDILEYPVPLFNELVETAAVRLGLKKEPMDPAAAFQKLGLSVRTESEHKRKRANDAKNKGN